MGLEEEALSAEKQRVAAAEKQRLAAAASLAGKAAAMRQAVSPEAVEFAALMERHGIIAGSFTSAFGDSETPIRGWIVRAYVRPDYGGLPGSYLQLDGRLVPQTSVGRSEVIGAVVLRDGRVPTYALEWPGPRRLLSADSAEVSSAELLQIATEIVAGRPYPIVDGQESAEERLQAAERLHNAELFALNSYSTGAEWTAFFRAHPDEQRSYRPTANVTWKKRSLLRLKSEFEGMGTFGYDLKDPGEGRGYGGAVVVSTVGGVAKLRGGDPLYPRLAHYWKPHESLPSEINDCLRKGARYALGIDTRPYRETR